MTLGWTREVLQGVVTLGVTLEETLEETQEMQEGIREIWDTLMLGVEVLTQGKGQTGIEDILLKVKVEKKGGGVENTLLVTTDTQNH